jgi:DNA-binding NarL/FixJ family response regulator
METIRVLIANRPRLIRELVMATISDQPDIEIVAELQGDSGIEAAVEQTRPDFLIVALDESDHLPQQCNLVMERHPRIKIIAIAPNRDTTMFYWVSVDIRSSRIESSEEGVLGALRGKGRPG